MSLDLNYVILYWKPVFVLVSYIWLLIFQMCSEMVVQLNGINICSLTSTALLSGPASLSLR